jgi:hypothetical protein
MLNSGKKKNSNSCVVRKKISERNKKHKDVIIYIIHNIININREKEWIQNRTLGEHPH